MSCRRMRRRWMLARDGGLPVEEELRLEHHAGQCAACAEFVRRSLALDAALEGVGEPPEDRLDVDRVVASILDSLDDAPPARRRTLRALPAAAALLIAAALGVGAWSVLAPERSGASGDAVTALRHPPAPSAHTQTVHAPKEHAPSVHEPTVHAPSAVAPSVQPAVHARSIPVARPDARTADLRAAVRDAISHALAACWTAAPPTTAAEREAFAVRVEERLVASVPSDWPIEATVRGLLDARTSADAAAPSAAYLGRRGGDVAAQALEDALGHAPTAIDASLAATCIDALGDMGPRGAESLGRLAAGAAWGPAALEALRRSPAEARLVALEAALEERPGAERAEVLAAELARCGAAGADRIIDRCRRGRLDVASAVDALATSPFAGRALEARLADERSARRDAPLLLRLVAAVRPPGAVDWLRAVATERPLHADAIECLASYSTTPALEALFALHGDGFVSDRELVRVVGPRIEPGHDAAERFLSGSPDAGGRARFLVACRSRGASDALLRAARDPALAVDDRRAAALALSEVGAERHVDPLVALVLDCDVRERYLAASALLTLHELGGEDAVRRALSGAPPSALERVLGRLARGADAASVADVCRTTYIARSRRLTP